jgi:uncharacterized membrane protein YjgN (DUF898 family)
MTHGTLSTDFVGRRGPLFRLALKTGVLTVLTLGIYRFWMKTRLRRYYWSSVRPGGHPLEYVGEPLEKLLGFLIAVVILAFYIGVVNLVLMFFSFAVLHGNVTAYALSFVGVIPLWFYALYRARRYVLGRTRWRGLRFGVDPGAWGYAWRAMVHWAVTILTLGVLWPRMTFWLEKYRTDRTWLGTWQFEQGGRWQMLYAPFRMLLATVLVGLTGIVLLSTGIPYGWGALVVAALAFLPAVVNYRVQALRILTNHKAVGGLRLRAEPRATRVFGIYIGGYLLVFLCMGLLMSGLAVALGAAAGSFDVAELGEVPIVLGTILAIASYFAVFLMWGALRHVFVTLPIWRHYAETLTVTGAEDLSSLRQRRRDAFREAEGFADALDLGAAI